MSVAKPPFPNMSALATLLPLIWPETMPRTPIWVTRALGSPPPLLLLTPWLFVGLSFFWSVLTSSFFFSSSFFFWSRLASISSFFTNVAVRSSGSFSKKSVATSTIVRVCKKMPVATANIRQIVSMFRRRFDFSMTKMSPRWLSISLYSASERTLPGSSSSSSSSCLGCGGGI